MEGVKFDMKKMDLKEHIAQDISEWRMRLFVDNHRIIFLVHAAAMY